jgi:hypothetical protein
MLARDAELVEAVLRKSRCNVNVCREVYGTIDMKPPSIEFEIECFM